MIRDLSCNYSVLVTGYRTRRLVYREARPASSRYPRRMARKGIAEVSRSQRRKTAQEPWLSAAEQQAWSAFMRVQMRMNYEMNRELQSDSDLSLADYHVLNALTAGPGGWPQRARSA